MTQTSRELREFTRVLPHIQVQIEVQAPGGPVRLEGRTRDISMNGLYAECTGGAGLAAESPCQATLVLGGGQHIQVHARVVRGDEAGVALSFVEILGLDSYQHLRNLLLFNAEATAQVEKEMQEHIGLRRPLG